MPTLNMNDQMTAFELVKRANAPEAFHIIEIMRMTNQMLVDVPAKQANNGTINVTTQRVTKEAGEHRIYNRGVGKSATQTKVIHDRIAVLSTYSDVDKDMADHSGNVAETRRSEAISIIKGMGLTQARTLIYGDSHREEEFAGLFERRNSLALPDVINAGGTGSALTSIYMVAIGPDLFHLIYPQGAANVGVKQSDRGELDVKDSNNPNKEYPVYREYFEAQYGLTIRDPGAVKRICNIPATITGEALVDIILDTRRRMPEGAATYALYANLDVLIKLDKTARDKGNVTYTAADPWGKEVTMVRDLRCRQMDVILSTEEAVA
ncbi:hypothetical protein AGMMS50268_21200 [Spirochaetia bacterium]|nr:hypothetical protein AGMMS50268_21200 [Spirochaetia bacterium]